MIKSKPPTPEQLIPIIVKTLREYPLWARRDLWLAQMVMEMVKERVKRKHMACPHGGLSAAICRHPVNFHRDGALRDFSLSVADYEWLKGKVGE